MDFGNRFSNETISKLTNVKFLHLNHFTHTSPIVPATIIQLTKLNHLGLGGTPHIQPDQLRHFQHLTYLRLMDFPAIHSSSKDLPF